jgi:hypothetical protein
VKSAAAAVGRKKRHDLRIVRDYLRSLPQRQFPEIPQWQFDVVTVYCEGQPSVSSGKKRATGEPRALHPSFELFQNAALSS